MQWAHHVLLTSLSLTITSTISIGSDRIDVVLLELADDGRFRAIVDDFWHEFREIIKILYTFLMFFFCKTRNSTFLIWLRCNGNGGK